MKRQLWWAPIPIGLVIFAFPLAGAESGAISGKVTTPDGTGIDAALTLHDLSTVRVVGSHAFDYQFASKRSGDFVLSGVPPGKYEICVDAPHQVVLDPCLWGTHTPKFDVTAGQTTPKIDLTVERGYLLQVRVNDPSKALPAAVGGLAGPALQMIVQTQTGRYENLRLQGADATGRNHYLVIPYETPLLLTATTASSSGLVLSDSNHQRYANGSALVPILVLSGGSHPVVTFNVAKP